MTWRQKSSCWVLMEKKLLFAMKNQIANLTQRCVFCVSKMSFLSILEDIWSLMTTAAIQGGSNSLDFPDVFTLLVQKHDVFVFFLFRRSCFPAPHQQQPHISTPGTEEMSGNASGSRFFSFHMETRGWTWPPHWGLGGENLPQHKRMDGDPAVPNRALVD